MKKTKGGVLGMLQTVLRRSPTKNSRVNATGETHASPPEDYSIDDALRDYFAPVIRAAGFKGSGRNFWRVTDAFALVVNVQGSMSGGRFAVNLGLQPLLLLDEEPRKLKEYRCDFRQRLSENDCDQWWRYSTSPLSTREAAKAAATVFSTIGAQAFEQQTGPDAPILSISAAEFSETEERFSGFRNNLTRTARALALLREKQGDRPEAIKFAEIARGKAGRAIGLAKEMTDLIERAS
jgi:hypothetical protein